MSSVLTKHYDGDLTVGRHETIGGNLTVRGSAKVGHDLRIEGWLDAPNVKGVMKGMFSTDEELKAAYPIPESGWIALVGDSFPATLWRAEKGVWTNTGTTVDVPGLDTQLTRYLTEMTEVLNRVSEVEEQQKVTDASVADSVEKLRNEFTSRLDTLTDKNLSDAIDNFNEVLRFLDGVTDQETLIGRITAMRNELRTWVAQCLALKQNKLTPGSQRVSLVDDRLNVDFSDWDAWQRQWNIADIYVSTSGELVGNADYGCSGFIPLNRDFPVQVTGGSSAGMADDVARIMLFDAQRRPLTGVPISNVKGGGIAIAARDYPADACYFAVSAAKSVPGTWLNAPTREGLLHGLSQLLVKLTDMLRSEVAAVDSRVEDVDLNAWAGVDLAYEAQAALASHITETRKVLFGEREVVDLFKWPYSLSADATLESAVARLNQFANGIYRPRLERGDIIALPLSSGDFSYYRYDGITSTYLVGDFERFNITREIQRINLELAGKQDYFTTTPDLTITDGVLGLTDRGQRAAFDARWLKLVGSYGNIDYTYFDEEGVSRPYGLNTLHLTYDEALEVDALGVVNTSYINSYAGAETGMRVTKARTNLPFVSGNTGAGGSSIGYSNANSFTADSLEVVRVPGRFRPRYISGTFMILFTGKNIHTVLGTVDLIFMTSSSWLEVGNTAAMENITFAGVDVNLNMSKAAKLTVASVRSMLTRIKTTALTHTVHPDVYAKLIGDTTNAAAAALSEEELAEWGAVLDLAVSKNVSFATV